MFKKLEAVAEKYDELTRLLADPSVAADHQNFVELDLVTSSGGQKFHAQHVARLNLVLFAACLEDREHGSFLLLCRALWPRS